MPLPALRADIAPHVVEPQSGGDRKKGHKERPCHVRVAKGGEVHHGIGDVKPVRGLGPGCLLNEPEYGERGPVPHQQLQEHAPAAMGKGVANRKHGGERRHEPHQHAKVFTHVHAERGERYRRRGIHAREYLRIVAHGAKAPVEERNRERKQEQEREVHQRIAGKSLPHAKPGIRVALPSVALRQEQKHLERQRPCPRHHRKQMRCVRPAEYPGEPDNRQEHEYDGKPFAERPHFTISFAAGSLRWIRQERTESR